jgi:hypothetical protein
MARWNTCNILQLAPEAKRLWQFNAKGAGFTLEREQKVPHGEALPARLAAKSWSTLWQPRLNVACLPPENVFLRVVELPAANAEETYSMVELQLEKLSPIPVTQLVWTHHQLGLREGEKRPDGTAESLQTIVVVIVTRAVVEELLGRLERDGFWADRLETPMLDLLAAIEVQADGVWLFPLTLAGQNAALTAWWVGGALRNLAFVTLPVAGDRAGELRHQLSLLAMAGEVEGWLSGPLKWHLVADPVNATEWEQCLRSALDEPVQVIAPPSPAEQAKATARRAAESAGSGLLPAEFTARYQEQFKDRLWLHALLYVLGAYGVFLAVYFCALGVLSYRTHQVETQVAGLSGTYTDAMQLKARYDILKQRSDLTYAALDCWQLVAQQLPTTINLQRFSFSNGHQLALGGTAPQEQFNGLLNFYDALKKVKVNGQFVFNQTKGDSISPRVTTPNTLGWNFTLELLRADEEAK